MYGSGERCWKLERQGTVDLADAVKMALFPLHDVLERVANCKLSMSGITLRLNGREV